MEKHKSIGLVALITIIMLSASFAAVLLGAMNTPQEKSIARTEAAVDFTIIGPTFTSNQYTDIVSAGGMFTYSVAISSASPYTVNQLNFQWTLKTDWETSVSVTGTTLSWMYMNESTRDIAVTVSEKTNSTNSTTEHITVQVIADFDKDDLPDVWERRYFNAITETDGTGDYDKDGWTDLEEFQNGTDPTVANPKPGFIETYAWLIALIAIVVVVLVLLFVVILPKQKIQRKEDEKKKIAAAVEVEKSLLGLDELEDKPKK